MLAEMIARYEQLEECLGRAMSYAQLLHAADTEDAEIGRFFQTVQERVNEISTKVLFVTLELNRIEDEALEAKLAASERLARYRPWIRDVRSFRPHQLDDEIERVLHEKAVTGRRAWTRLFDETMGALRFPYDGRQLTSAEIFDLLQDHDRARREGAARAIAEVLGRNVRLFALITNTLAKDKQLEDGWRKFPHPISSRNLANQVEDDVVDALIGAVRAAYPRRYCRAQGALARPGAPGVLGSQRALSGRQRQAGCLARCQGDRAGGLSPVLADPCRDRRPLLRPRLDRRGAAPRMQGRSAIRPCRACIPTC